MPAFQMVVKTFMDMDQDSEEEKELYLNLALHLASDFFLKHPDKDVRLLVACCLADIFRIYAPEAPYTSPDKLKVRGEGSALANGTKHWKVEITALRRDRPRFRVASFIGSSLKYSYSINQLMLLEMTPIYPLTGKCCLCGSLTCAFLSGPGHFHVHHKTAQRTGGH